MNADLKMGLQIIGGLAVVIGAPFLQYLAFRKIKKKNDSSPYLSTDELRTLATKNIFAHGGVVIKELKSRNEDYSFAVPLLLQLVARNNPAARIMGWQILGQHFANDLPDLDFSKSPTPQELDLIRSKLNRMQ